MGNERPNIRYTREVQEAVLEIFGLSIDNGDDLLVQSIHFEPTELTIVFHEQGKHLESPVIFETFVYPLVSTPKPYTDETMAEESPSPVTAYPEGIPAEQEELDQAVSDALSEDELIEKHQY